MMAAGLDAEPPCMHAANLIAHIGTLELMHGHTLIMRRTCRFERGDSNVSRRQRTQQI